MTSKILLNKIIERFREIGLIKIQDYTTFAYIRETPKAVYVKREKGKDTRVPFSKILIGIEAYINEPVLYDSGPSALRDFGITHLTSPVWSVLHLLKKEEYKLIN